MLPQLLFLLPGNHAQQCIKPRGLFPPACFLGSAACIYKAPGAFSSGAGSRAAVECPAGAPTTPPGSLELTWLLLPSPSPGSPTLLSKHWKNTAIAFCSAERECLPAVRLLQQGWCSPAFFWGAPESPGACHHAMEMAALPGGTLHLPHAFKTQQAWWQHDAPVPEAPLQEPGTRLPVTKALQRWHRGTSLPGGLCGNTAGAAAKLAPLPGVPLRQRAAPLLFVCCSSFRHPKALIQK